jgi:hypothetical protein
MMVSELSAPNQSQRTHCKKRMKVSPVELLAVSANNPASPVRYVVGVGHANTERLN